MIAVIQLLIAYAIGWAVSELALRRIFKEGVPEAIGGPERALLCLVGIVVFGIVSMLAHILSGGLVFGVSFVVPAIGAVTLVAALRRARMPRIPWRPLLVFVVALGALYILPAVLGGSTVRTGDSPWHLGWTNQLLAGEPVPTGPAPEFSRNAYPWGLHSHLATLVRLVPGSDVMDALESLHLSIVIAIPLAAASLARLLSHNAGWAGATAATMVGGFGWITAWGAAFATSPARARGADLVVASPNAVYQMFPPGLPRELGLALLAASAVFLALAMTDRRARIPAGIALGMVGLISVPMFVNGLVWFVGTFMVSPRDQRRDLLLRVGGATLVTFGLWAGPVVSYAIRYSGFVDITPRLGREWPLPVALLSWGILLPLAIGGGLMAVRARRVSARIVPVLVTGTTILLLLSKARGWFDWDLAGNATLLHQGRVWPAAHLLAAALAGVGALSAWRWLRERSRGFALAAASVALAVGMASPVLAAVKMTRVLRSDSAGFVYDDPDLAEGGFVREAAAHMGPDDVVFVEGPDELGWFLWQFSGARLASYDHPLIEPNDLRIRYNELAAAYAERIDSGGFEPNLLVVPAEDASDVVLATGSFDGRRWALISPKFLGGIE